MGHCFCHIVDYIENQRVKEEDTVDNEMDVKDEEGASKFDAVAESFDCMQRVQHVTRIAIENGEQVSVRVKALSTQQLRMYLPEFSLNMFSLVELSENLVRLRTGAAGWRICPASLVARVPKL